MARKPSKTLTDGELRIMRVLWRKRSASVRAVVDTLNETDEVAYNTVQTMLGILETKGYVEHHKEGRAFVYAPLVDKKTASASALKHFIGSFFDGSPRALVQNLLQHEDVDALEIDQLRRLLQTEADESIEQKADHDKELGDE